MADASLTPPASCDRQDRSPSPDRRSGQLWVRKAAGEGAVASSGTSGGAGGPPHSGAWKEALPMRLAWPVPGSLSCQPHPGPSVFAQCPCGCTYAAALKVPSELLWGRSCSHGGQAEAPLGRRPPSHLVGFSDCCPCLRPPQLCSASPTRVHIRAHSRSHKCAHIHGSTHTHA